MFEHSSSIKQVGEKDTQMLVSVPEPYNLFVWILMAMVEYKAVKKPDVNIGEIKK